jgi:hypothetical protein
MWSPVVHSSSSRCVNCRCISNLAAAGPAALHTPAADVSSCIEPSTVVWHRRRITALQPRAIQCKATANVVAPLSRNPVTVLTMGVLLPLPLPAAAASGMLLLLGSCNEKQRKGASCVSHVSHPPPPLASCIPKMASALLPLRAMGTPLRAQGYSLSAGHVHHLLSVQHEESSCRGEAASPV